MSNNDTNNKRSSPPTGEHLAESWQWTSSELKRALDQWDVVASEALGPAPDEKMLQNMQSLLAELKIKLDQLSK